MDTENTLELINELRHDFMRCADSVVLAVQSGELMEDGTTMANTVFDSRQLIRALFAYIEGATFTIKTIAIQICLNRGRELSVGEQFVAAEIRHELNDHGKVVERKAKLRFTSNVRFAFALLERAYGVTGYFDPSQTWWLRLKDSEVVRDRLMHPRLLSDLLVAPREVIAALEAGEGFEATLRKFKAVIKHGGAKGKGKGAEEDPVSGLGVRPT